MSRVRYGPRARAWARPLEFITCPSKRRFERDQDDRGKFSSGGWALARGLESAGGCRVGLRTRAMRLESHPCGGLRSTGLCIGLGSAALSRVCLEARPLGPLADDLPVGFAFRTVNRPAGVSACWPIENSRVKSSENSTGDVEQRSDAVGRLSSDGANGEHAQSAPLGVLAREQAEQCADHEGAVPKIVAARIIALPRAPQKWDERQARAERRRHKTKVLRRPGN